MRDGVKRRLLFREVNKAIREVSRRLDLATYQVFCECERADCGERIEVPASFYEHVLGEKGRFVVLPTHEERVSESVESLPAA
jgi:hypothetical protein